jgi:hypothetical protein
VGVRLFVITNKTTNLEKRRARAKGTWGLRDKTPPLWVRHLLSWRFLRWLDSHLATCWVGIAMWKMGYPDQNWWGGTCWDGPKGQEYDYCGKWDDEASFVRDRRS